MIPSKQNFLDCKYFELTKTTEQEAQTTDNNNTFNSSNRVLPLSMIYSEDFNLNKSVTIPDKRNSSILQNTKNTVTDRTRATIKESSQAKRSSSKSTVNQVLNYSQNSLPMNKTFQSRQQRQVGADTTGCGLTRISSSGHNFSFSMNNMDHTNNTTRVGCAVSNSFKLPEKSVVTTGREFNNNSSCNGGRLLLTTMSFSRQESSIQRLQQIQTPDLP